MLSLIKNYPGRALASAFKLKTSVLPLPYVATRHFLTTSPSQSPAQKAGKEASSKPSTARKSDGKLDVKSKTKSANSTKQDKPPAKPKKFTKKDLTPPTKRPMSSFATFAQEYRTKQLQDSNSSTPILLADTLRNAAAEWANFSDEDKQKYAPSPEALEAHRLALKEWQDGLSPQAKRALRVRRRREKGTGHALFLSETFHQATGDTFGEKISERNTVWKSLSDEEKTNYSKRAAETSFGIRAERAAQHERKIQKDAKKKIEAQEKKKNRKGPQAERAGQAEKVGSIASKGQGRGVETEAESQWGFGDNEERKEK